MSLIYRIAGCGLNVPITPGVISIEFLKAPPSATKLKHDSNCIELEGVKYIV